MSVLPSVMESLVKNVNPVIEKINPDELIPKNLITDKFETRIHDMPIQTAEAGYVSVYGVASSGNTYVGDTWGYITGERNIAMGRTKTKKFTATIKFSEDEMDRVQANNASFIKDAVEHQMRVESVAMANSIEKMAFGMTAADVGYDPEVVPVLGLNATSSVGNPQDCNPTPGTAMSLTTTVWSGTGQTMNNIEALLGAIDSQIASIEHSDTKNLIPWGKITLIVNPIFYAVLKHGKDKISSTQSSLVTYLQELESRGYEVLKSTYVDPTYTKTSGNSSKIIVVGNIGYSFIKGLIPPPEGFVWHPWDKARVTENGISRIYYVQEKKAEVYLLARAYDINKSDGSIVWKKPVIHVSTTPFANT